MSEQLMIDESGSCYCGRVHWRARGKLNFSIYCHCRPCTRARGSSPMHLVGIPDGAFTVTAGDPFIKVTECTEDQLTKSYENARPMTHAFCAECGSFIYQRPKGADFKALSPAAFKIETAVDKSDEAYICGVSCKLPESLRPTAHMNYENRLYDSYDDLPKFRTFPHRKVRLSNNGAVLEE